MSFDDAFDDDDEFSTSGFPDWWEPVEEGELLTGHVRDMRSPFDDDGTVLEIETEDGTQYSTRPHTDLCSLIEMESVEIGDLVQIRYDGTKSTDNGDMYTYAMRVAGE